MYVEHIHFGLSYAFLTSNLGYNIYQFIRNKSRTQRQGQRKQNKKKRCLPVPPNACQVRTPQFVITSTRCHPLHTHRLSVTKDNSPLPRFFNI